MNRARAGRAGYSWRKLSANLRAMRYPCWICGQPIDYSLRYPDPASFSVDHAAPLALYPHLAEDPTNLRASHLRCNLSRGQAAKGPSLGATSRRW